MIDTIQLENYRCFEKVSLKLKDIVVLVGQNNAGKSSLLEAFRLCSIAVKKAIKTTYKEIPFDLVQESRIRGYRIDTERLKIDLRGIVYLYEDKVARITLCLDNGVKIVIVLNSNYAYAILFDKNDNNIKNRSQAQQFIKDKIEILPRISLIKENEKKISDEIVINDRDSYLFSRHFRNEILLYKKEYWNEFVKIAEETWENLKIKGIEYDYFEDEYIKLFVSDARFMAELGLMGSGLQMWLQIMWFIARSKDCNTIILDEPDIYMHPDLQRKLIRILKNKFPQIIIATHSVEMISEVDPYNIVLVDKKRRKLSYATDMKVAQDIVDKIGSMNNLSLARIGYARKCIFVEGNDIKLLSKFVDILYPELSESIDNLPVVKLQGFNNLNESFGASKLFFDETHNNVKCFCILDRDYFPDEVIENKIIAAEKNHMGIHIWNRKEIENYLIEPFVLFKMTKQDISKYSEFRKKYEMLIDEEKDYIFDQISEHILLNEKCNPSDANKKARKILNEKWNDLESKIALVGGKKFLSKTIKWLNTEYGINCRVTDILRFFSKEDVCEEVKKVINILLG